MRGTADRTPDRSGRDRFIPACAGNSPHDQHFEIGAPVHPRVCGEQITNEKPLFSTNGFIPACAGNSSPPHERPAYEPVHPRVCGEQNDRLYHTRCVAGSSPRVRGTVGIGQIRPAVLRFIPACAGNRTPRTTGRWRSTVHPRVCGEQAAVRHVDNLVVGSSPRVRGTGAESPRAMGDSRFIPACAGNSHGHADPRC